MSIVEAQKLLHQSFGFAEFRPGQREAVEALLSGRDALVVMPTGSGKSLVYQLPSLALPGVTLVVSPLIALMKDQVDDLVAKGISATFINSSISANEIATRLADVKDDKIKLLYIAPERFYDQAFVRSLGDISVSLFAIDEAHCISEWGHDFRPSYRKLGEAIAAAGRPPVVALTATATPDVRDDIMRSLKLNDPFVVVTGFDRPNLTYGVMRATPTLKVERVLELIEKVNGPAIVYAGTRDGVDTLVDVLGVHDVSAAAYHAGMEKTDRDANQQRFMDDKVQVIVATNAFGLGIDKPNVRLVAHFDFPGTLEAYYQEAGRAGRDGQPSYAVLLYHPSDRYLREFFLNGENPSAAFVRAVYAHLTRQVGDVIHTTHREILEGTNMRVPELAVSTALKYLEAGGYVHRAREGEVQASLQFLRPLDEVDAAIAPRAKVQRQVWEALRQRFDEELVDGVHFAPEQLVRSTGLARDALNRSLKAMTDKGLCVYEPPFRGQELTMLKRVSPETLEIDWHALAEKRRHEEAKLEAMEHYINTGSCRRHMILRYLGEQLSTTRCSACDNCGA